MPTALVERNHHRAIVQNDMALVIKQRSGFKNVSKDFYHPSCQHPKDGNYNDLQLPSREK